VTLAVVASVVGQILADWEHDRRERMSVQGAWMPIEYPWTRGR